MGTLEALKNLAKKICSNADDTELAEFDTVDKVIDYMQRYYDGAAIGDTSFSIENGNLIYHVGD